jgi:hypothetical protein
MTVSMSVSLRTGAAIGVIFADRAAVSNAFRKWDPLPEAVPGLNMNATCLTPKNGC